ncbi:hypothetical protein F6X40_18225 [Paraburkholderia sp. UCT31]|nr:hypothetical protein [Paraburkholderia sp. UCT31]
MNRSLTRAWKSLKTSFGCFIVFPLVHKKCACFIAPVPRYGKRAILVRATYWLPRPRERVWCAPSRSERSNTLATIPPPRHRPPRRWPFGQGRSGALRHAREARSDTTWHRSCCYCPARALPGRFSR